ncbi:MAG TPA: ADP/ATP-dependent (S)-NAD(P)H-hydrate dehydratase, partial [Anaerolineae bacterium]|nr:ADP/ATP-dependent (S)-NAD(P)H-hydrate dehydratase [Anaerolineae bacterium]
GQAPPTTRFMDALLSALADYKTNEPPAELLPIVFDADALNILAGQPDWWTRLPENSILTPHPGEMSRLTKKPIAELEANRLTVVSEMAQRWGQIIIFKGAFTVVASPGGEVVVMPFANPALATAGSGDVLAGCVVGFLGQRLPPFEAAVAGAYLHGLAGELARERFWEGGVVASDLLPLLPLALKEVTAGL